MGAFDGVEWDKEVSGILGHPLEVIDDFLKLYKISLLEFDEAGYIELETILEQYARAVFPTL